VTDPRARELERRAGQGDLDARTSLIALRLRQGMIEALSLEDQVALYRAVMDALPNYVSDEEHLIRWERRNGNWFPDWENNLVCPRGHAAFQFWRDEDDPDYYHSSGDTYFTLENNYGIVSSPTIYEDRATIGYEDHDITGGWTNLLSCSDCGATWRLQGDVEFE